MRGTLMSDIQSASFHPRRGMGRGLCLSPEFTGSEGRVLPAKPDFFAINGHKSLSVPEKRAAEEPTFSSNPHKD